MAAKRVISRPMPDAAPVITMAGCKSFASLAVTLGAMSQSMQLALSTKARRSVQLGRCVGLGNSPALKSDDAAALRGGRHLDDLGLLAELAAVRLRRVHGCRHPAFGIGNLAALLISGHSRGASALARAGASRHRGSEQRERNELPHAANDGAMPADVNSISRPFNHAVPCAFSR